MKRLPRPALIAAVGAIATSGYAFVVRPWLLTWGANRFELDRHLPGDDLVPVPKIESTRAITIHATPSEIWPWLLQMGQGRGGLYSYDWLENLFGLNFQSADRIIAELQDLKIGDVIPLAPGSRGPAFSVAAIEPESALVLNTRVNTTTWEQCDLNGDSPESYFNTSWVFFLDPVGEKTTRLIVRTRVDWSPGILNEVAYHVLGEPIFFIMEQKMMRGIKERAEGRSKEREARSK